MINWKDVAVRSIKTFVQTFVSVLGSELVGMNLFDGTMTETVWIGIGLSAGAAACSAVWNGVLEPLFKTKPPEENK